MAKGMNKMQSRLAKVDCFLEVHDSRIPFSGRNPQFYNKLTAIRPHILVLNKMDLADMQPQKRIKEVLMRREPHLADVIWTNAKTQYHQTIKNIVPLVTKVVEEKAIHVRRSDLNIMAIGVPNTGKSSVINALRRCHVNKSNSAPVADYAGVTRAVQERIKLSDNPPTYLLDTPGVSDPHVSDSEVGMRLALCACFKDSLIGEDIIADYLLYYMNKRGLFHYVQFFNLDEPTDDVYVLLVAIAKTNDLRIKIRNIDGGYKMKYDVKRAAKYLLSQFRKGTLGNFLLDSDKLEEFS